MSSRLATAFLSPAFAVNAVLRLISGRDWQSVKSRVGDLVSAATIATFLAAVQSQVVALSYQDNSTHLKAATNIFGFAGMLLDVTSACLGLLLSALLQRHITVVEAQINAIEDASPQQLQEIIQLVEATGVRSGLRPSLRWLRDFPELFRRVHAKINARLAVLAKQNANGDGAGLNPPTDSPDLYLAAVPESLAQIQSLVSIASAASGAMALGVLCFFGSVLCLAISTQPPVVWIVAVALTAWIAVLAAVGLLLLLPSAVRDVWIVVQRMWS